MKINNIKNQSVNSKSVKKRSGAGKDISFASLLGGHIQPLEEPPVPASVQKIEQTSSVSTATRLDGVALSEKAIDVLEAYSDALKNLELDTEDLMPLIEALEGETTAILDIKEQLDDDDPLAELLDRIAAVAYLEAEKYRRGDYDS